MTKAAHYSQAAFPKPFRILGIRLKPLSLDHYLIMARPELDVAFVAEDSRTATFADVIVGILVCSRRWKEGEFDEFIDSGEYGNTLTDWANQAGIPSEQEQDEKIKLFQEYIVEGSKIPAHFPLRVGSSGATHWTQNLLNTLKTHLGYTHSEALHAPLTQVLADYFLYAESQGAVRLISPEMKELLDSGALDFRLLTPEEAQRV